MIKNSWFDSQHQNEYFSLRLDGHPGLNSPRQGTCNSFEYFCGWKTLADFAITNPR
jgi:hypothetical protein